MTDPECPLSELPASQCACPNHRGGTTPAEEVRTVGQSFEAAYRGVCARCDGPIRPGQTILRTPEAVPDYVHAGRCPQ